MEPKVGDLVRSTAHWESPRVCRVKRIFTQGIHTFVEVENLETGRISSTNLKKFYPGREQTYQIVTEDMPPLGPKPKRTWKRRFDYQRAVDLREEGMSIKDIARNFNVTASAIQKAIETINKQKQDEQVQAQGDQNGI